MIAMTVRERTQLIEEQILSPSATLSKNTKGRVRPEEECEMRTAFQRDRDRIIHCKAFRRLKHKTQVFLSPEGDHYRTRLTHTLEVSQIARTIARGLQLNEDLTEAISLGHDLGHTPFGHAGERVLDALCENGFRHNEQSVRVVEKLENEGRGLNLTEEVRDGILCHSGDKMAQTPEGRVVRWADKIAYINHDIDDAVRAGVLSEDEIPEHITQVMGKRRSMRIDTMVKSVIRASHGENITMEEPIYPLFLELRKFMFDTVYFNPYAKKEEAKVPFLLKTLFEYARNPKNLPEDLRLTAEQEGIEQAAADYIAGMTDRYAVELFREISVPKSWDH